MKIFIHKIFIFILPFIIVNSIFLRVGYLFSSKNNSILIHNLKSYEPGKINIKFFGTSRIESGISPEDVENGFLMVDKNKKVKVSNCGMDAEMTGWGLMMQEKYFSPCDLMIIEVHPGKNPMQGIDKTKKQFFISDYLDQFLSYYFSHFAVINNLPLLISDLRGRLPIKYMNAHINGWT
jgi:hypothetical protein